MRVRPTVFILLLFGLVPSLAFALALGEIKLNSGLNEALNAEIEIISATPEEIKNLTAAVASRETFERYGLDRPDFLTGLRFRVDRTGSGNVLRVFSTQPISEPFVTFLVEAQWRRGRLLREYTVLLDPPIFLPNPQQAAPAPVAPPQSARSQYRPSAGQIERAPAPSRTSRYGSTPPAFGTTYGPIRRNETLWNIAARLRTDKSITMNQMMVAIYQSNQGAFLGNINLMKEGSVLRIPDRSTIESQSQPDAYAMAVAHNQAWRAGRPTQVAVAGVAPTQIRPDATDSSRLRLVEPDATAGAGSDAGTGTSAGSNAASRETLARNEADIARLSSENDQLRADLEEIRRLLNVRDGALAELQQQIATKSAGPAVSPDVTAPSQTGTTPSTTTASTSGQTSDAGQPVAATTTPGGATETGTATPSATDSVTATEPETDTSATTAVAPPVVRPPVVTSLPDEPGFIAKAIDLVKGAFSSLWLWIALGVAALAVFGLAVMRGRGEEEQDVIEALTREARDSSPDTVIMPKAKEQPAATAGAASDVEFFDDSGTFKPVDFSAAQTPDSAVSGEYPFEDTVGGEIKLDQSDPLAEADFHMAYGLYDQASDLVKKAIAREPKRIDLRIKLLEIFFVWGNEGEFRSTAQELHDTMSGEIASEWDKIVIMGKQICPDDELFAGDTAMGASADIDLEFEPTGAQSAVDLDTGGEPLDPGLDLDIGGALGLAPDSDSAGTSQGGAFDTVNELLDFDLGDEQPDLDEDDDTRPEPVERIKDQIRAVLSSTDNDETAEMDLSDLGVDLDLAGSSGLSEAAVSDADPNEVSDFGDIFDSPVNETDQTSELPAATSEMDVGSNALDLDIGDIFGDMDTADDEETARDLAALEESMEQTGSQDDTGDTGDTGHFSAEVETLHGDALDVDISSFQDDESSETRLIAPEDATGTPVEEAFSASIFGGPDPTGHVEDTFSSAVFGASDADETRMIGPDSTPGADGDLVGNLGDEDTVQVPAAADDSQDLDLDLDLDIGDAMTPNPEDASTARVATSELALPGTDDELSEVGTKLDLARAYMDMGDPVGARGILEEVLAEGNEGQQADAREMLSSLG